MPTSIQRPSPDHAPAAALSISARGPEFLRRGLLVLIVALVVARPLVGGEDIGLVEPLSNAWGLLLTFGWLLTAVGWAVWRSWTGRAVWRGSAVEVGLLAVVLAVLITTWAAAAYKHPGWIALGEWFGILIAFCLVRQLAIGPNENRRLAAVLAALGVALACQGLYERVFEIPHELPHGRITAPAVQKLLANEGYFLSEQDPGVQARAARLHQRSISATYQHPATFACLLILTLPLLFAGAAAVVRWRPWPWRLGAALLCMAVVLAALLLTHARMVMLPLIGTGIVFALVRGRRLLWRRPGWTAALAIIVGAGFYFALSTPAGQRVLADDERLIADRVTVWHATWDMIRDHGWLGVGQGSFGRFYPRYQAVAGPPIHLPQNFALELWATCGLLGLAGILLAVGAVLLLAWRNCWAEPATAAPLADETPSGLPWEFYIGGMCGLCLGIILWGLEQPLEPKTLLWGGFVAGGRSLIWFLAFAFFESIEWSQRGLARVLGWGVAAVLVAWIVVDGISFPALTQPLWIAAGLTLNLSPGRLPILESTARPRVLLPLPILAAVCIGYLFWIMVPALTSAVAMRGAHAYAELYHREPSKRPTYGWAERRTVDGILDHLQDAVQADPGNVLPGLEYAGWAELSLSQFPGSRSGLAKQTRGMLGRVQQLDRENKEGYTAMAVLDLLEVRQGTSKRAALLRDAADALKRAVQLDPTNERLRTLQAHVLLQGAAKPTQHQGRKAPVRPPARRTPGH